jgi:anaerobic selenocysteine-containing dehydrogenase
MILVGGSSMHKGANGWQGGRAVACLPALTGNLGIPGGGLGPRHGSTSHGQALASIVPTTARPSGTYIPNQMSRMIESLLDGRVRAMLLFGSDMLSSFADAGRLETGFARTELVVCHDLFMNGTARRFADVVLPGTAWLEQLGCKMTNTHLYLMEQALEPPGETRSLTWMLRTLADRLGLTEFFPWETEEAMINAILAHPSTGYATVAGLRAEGGIRAMNISHVAYPDHRYDTPSTKVELFSDRARALGLPPLPVYENVPHSPYPLTLCQGRTLTHFHSFYDHGRALPSLAKLDPVPRLWISPLDAAARGLHDGGPIRIYNERGEFQAYAQVTERIPSGTVWMRDGWEGLNRLTSGAPAIPDVAVDIFHFSAGQAAFEAMVEVAPA